MGQAERIKFLRKELNLSQSKFGEKLGVSKAVIVNLENNRVELKEMMTKLICRTFNVNPLWLTEGKGDIFFETEEIILELLSKEYDLDNLETSIIKNFIKLSKEERQQVINLAKKLITDL